MAQYDSDRPRAWYEIALIRLTLYDYEKVLPKENGPPSIPDAHRRITSSRVGPPGSVYEFQPMRRASIKSGMRTSAAAVSPPGCAT
ncbi:hypothetical protein EVAR_102598_1 [Eumeta japonica]|uniref:Uncharacterized protein n=1 Tax=Eumeta variegata TaxID=151549 RepID=A0A4C1TUS0_EUMVA|nr:hypothetical protein EVAR_102598_1 [Eumeta japonica]